MSCFFILLWEKLLLYLFGFGISDAFGNIFDERTFSSTTPEKRSPL
ncbi:MAG: hypothetical protein V7K25_11040 [Nostoc sp.]